jgi:hypothetical protein
MFEKLQEQIKKQPTIKIVLAVCGGFLLSRVLLQVWDYLYDRFVEPAFMGTDPVIDVVVITVIITALVFLYKWFRKWTQRTKRIVIGCIAGVVGLYLTAAGVVYIRYSTAESRQRQKEEAEKQAEYQNRVAKDYEKLNELEQEYIEFVKDNPYYKGNGMQYLDDKAKGNIQPASFTFEGHIYKFPGDPEDEWGKKRYWAVTQYAIHEAFVKKHPELHLDATELQLGQAKYIEHHMGSDRFDYYRFIEQNPKLAMQDAAHN